MPSLLVWLVSPPTFGSLAVLRNYDDVILDEVKGLELRLNSRDRASSGYADLRGTLVDRVRLESGGNSGPLSSSAATGRSDHCSSRLSRFARQSEQPPGHGTRTWQSRLGLSSIRRLGKMLDTKREKWLAAVFITFISGRLLAPDVAGVITNDSIHYLSRSVRLSENGLVVQGYRQVAYPIWVWVADVVGEVLGWDTVFGVALMQRTLLVVAAIVVWTSMRWWSVPILVVVSSSSFVVQTDFLLPEGLLIPGSFLVAALAASHVRQVGVAVRFPLGSLVAMALIGCWMAAVKLQYAALLLLALAVGWQSVRDGNVTRRAVAWVLGGALMAVGVLTLAQAVENQRELGVFEPVAERGRVEWYGAWQAIFSVENNAENPSLSEWYADGDLHTFTHGIEATEPDYRKRAPIFRDRVSQMFDAAGTSALSEKAKAFIGAIRGGRVDDLGGIVSRIGSDQSGSQRSRFAHNYLADSDGVDSLLAQINKGERPAVVTAEPVLDVTQKIAGDYRGWRPWLGIGALLSLGAGLLIPGRHRVVVIAVLTMLAGVWGVLASAYLDVGRHLVGPMTVSLVAGTLCVEAIAVRLVAEVRAIIARREAGDRIAIPPHRSLGFPSQVMTNSGTGNRGTVWSGQFLGLKKHHEQNKNL